MKEKDTGFWKKTKALLCLIASLIATLLLGSIIYFLVFHPLLESKAAKVLVNVGWIHFCLYAFNKLTQRYSPWRQALEENSHKSKKN